MRVALIVPVEECRQAQSLLSRALHSFAQAVDAALAEPPRDGDAAQWIAQGFEDMAKAERLIAPLCKGVDL